MSLENTTRTPFEMSEIAPGSRRGWELEVNGEPVSDVRSATLRNPQMGVELTYGQRPEGYDGPVIHEPGGGGSVTIPYLINPNDGRVYIGVVEEHRAAAGGMVRNVPRGFLDPGERHIEGAIRETAEETGIRAYARRFIDLGGGVTPNSAFFDTSRTTADGRPEGASFFALPVHLDEVEPTVAEDGSLTFRFREDIRDMAEGDKVGERILGSVFIPMGEAVASPDMYTSAAAGRLAAHLMGNGALRLAQVTDPRQG